VPDREHPWIIETDAEQQRYAFFLSHVSEDKPFVLRVKQLLEPRLRRARARLADCFLDTKNWQRGRPALSVLQDAIAISAHFAVVVTPEYLQASRRGWTWIEFAFGYLIEKSRQRLDPDLDPFIVPIFRGVTAENLGRTPLVEFWHSNLLQPGDDWTPAVVAEHLAKSFFDAEAKATR
jgi:hypothetical protein